MPLEKPIDDRHPGLRPIGEIIDPIVDELAERIGCQLDQTREQMGLDDALEYVRRNQWRRMRPPGLQAALALAAQVERLREVCEQLRQIARTAQDDRRQWCDMATQAMNELERLRAEQALEVANG